MSFLPDLTPLIQQIKEFNTNQLATNQILTEIKENNSQIKELLIKLTKK
jgi:hypothetical protein